MNEQPIATPVALYARVSSDRQDVDLSVAAQLRALREHADKNGYVVVREFVDEAESGRVADRPQFQEMLDEAKSSQAPFEEILVWKFSRFTRKREHAVAFKSMLRRRGIRVVSITEQADDTAAGRLLEGIIESVDEFYSENLAQDVLRGMREAASRGFWVASYAPFGYNRVMVQDGPKKRPTLVPDPNTSGVVKRIFDMAEAGKGTIDIARILNEEGILSPRGKLWGKTSVHAILINEAYTGTLVWGSNSKHMTDPVRVEEAFPSVITGKQFDRVSKLLRSRAPKIVHPRRTASPFLLSGLVKCRTCKRTLTGQYSKSPRYSYYVCQTLMKRGSGACDAPRLNARRFEELVVERIRSNILTESCMPDLVKLMGDEMEAATAEQRKRLQTIEAEIQEVKRQLGRLWRFIETSDDVDGADLSTRIREHRDRQERLEEAASDASAVLELRRSAVGDGVDIAAYARDMTDFLDESELVEARAFVKSFVKEIVVKPGFARVRYTLPMPDGSLKTGMTAEVMGLNPIVSAT